MSEDFGNFGDFVNAHEGIDFGQELGQILTKPLRQAAGDDDRLAAVSGAAQCGGLEDGVHAFLLGRINKGAGVDDDHVGLGGIIGDLDAVLQEGAEHDLGVHEVLGAAERNHADPHWALLSGSHSCLLIRSPLQDLVRRRRGCQALQASFGFRRQFLAEPLEEVIFGGGTFKCLSCPRVK